MFKNSSSPFLFRDGRVTDSREGAKAGIAKMPQSPRVHPAYLGITTFSMFGRSFTKTLDPHSHSISAVPKDFSKGLPHLMHLYIYTCLRFCLSRGGRSWGLNADLRRIGAAGKLMAAVSALPNSRSDPLDPAL